MPTPTQNLATTRALQTQPGRASQQTALDALNCIRVGARETLHKLRAFRNLTARHKSRGSGDPAS
eukprot:11075912-Lingulodinium_polyedra.AAC.3